MNKILINDFKNFNLFANYSYFKIYSQLVLNYFYIISY